MSVIPKTILTIGTLGYNVSFTLPGLSATFLYFDEDFAKNDLIEIQVINVDCNTKVYSDLSTSGASANIYNVFTSSDYKPI